MPRTKIRNPRNQFRSYKANSLVATKAVEISLSAVASGGDFVMRSERMHTHLI